MTQETVMGFGPWLKSVRLSQKLTTYQFAQMLGCESWYVSSMERGEVTPSIHLRERIAEISRIPLDYVDAKIKITDQKGQAKAKAKPKQQKDESQLHNVVNLQTYRDKKCQKIIT